MESEIKQFKSLIELRDYIRQFDGFRARPIRDGDHPTLYTVTERMHVSQLRQKLLWMADRMQKITSGGKVL